MALLPQHEGLSRDDLIGVRFPSSRHGGAIRQYEFHEGRADFQDASLPWPAPSETAAPASRRANTPAVPSVAGEAAADLASTSASDSAQGA